MRTEQETKQEIQDLKAIKSKVPATTFFGDDNHAAIDAQIQVIQDTSSTDSRYVQVDIICDQWPDDGKDMHVRDAALQALDWLNGAEGKPSEDWQELVK